MDDLPSPFRLDVKSALVEMIASIPVFWIVYQLGFGGESALMISVAALYGVRLWRKGVFGPPDKRVSDRHIPILSPGHALSWCHIFCLAGWGAALDGADTDEVIRNTLYLSFLLAMAVACQYAWRLYRSGKNESSKG